MTKPAGNPLKNSPQIVGAGVAAAVGLVWLLAPGFNSPKPEAPSSTPALAMPERVVPQAKTAVAASRRVEAAFTAETKTVQTASFSKPAWVDAATPPGWVWPRHIQIQGDGVTIDRRLVGWHPKNAAGKTLLYSLTVDRTETRMYEDEIPAFEARIAAEEAARVAAEDARKRALAAPPAAARNPAQMTPEEIAATKARRGKALQEFIKSKGAASGKDISDYAKDPWVGTLELTFADGRKELIHYDPLVFDLKGTGVKTSPKKVLFDLIGFGKSDKTQWMNDLEEGTGVLVFDAKGTGRSGKNGSEVFGDRTDLEGLGRPSGFANGFEALHAFVRKAVKEGVLKQDSLDKGVLDAAALVALEKAYGLKMKLGGMNREPVSLARAGVAEIALSRAPIQRAANFDGQGNDLLLQPGAVFKRADGSTGGYMNVWLAPQFGNLGLKTGKHLNL